MVPPARKGIIEIIQKYSNISNLISISSSTYVSFDKNPLTVIDYDNKTSRLETNRNADNFFKITFKESKLLINAYRIRSGNTGVNSSHLKNWSLYGSNDEQNWVLLDRKENNAALNGPYFTHIFKIKNPQGPFSSFKINETDSWCLFKKMMFGEFDVYDTSLNDLYKRCSYIKTYHFHRIITLIYLIS